MPQTKIEDLSFIGLFLLAGILLYFVVAPFVQVLVIAAVFAAIFHHPYEELHRHLRGWKNGAALIVTGIVFIFFVLPPLFLGLQIFHETTALASASPGGVAQYVEKLQTPIEHYVQKVVPTFSIDINAFIKNIVAFISNNLASIATQTLLVVLETFLMLVAFYFFLRDGRDILTRICAASPIGVAKTEEILHDMHLTARAIISGVLVISLIRLVCLGLTFYIFHIPNAALWSLIGGIIGAIPSLGTVVVLVPAIIFLYVTGSVTNAIGLALAGLLLIAVVDFILPPYFFGRGLPVPMIFVLFSILGGIIFFGPLGFIFGPLVLSAFHSIAHIIGRRLKETAS